MRKKTAFFILATLFVLGAGGFYFIVGGVRPHQETIYEYSALYHVDPLLSLAVAEVESGFDETAVSKKGAVGLMQLMPVTALEEAGDLHLSGVRPDNLGDPRLNIQLGVHHLSRLSQQFKGNPVLTLAAYNAGSTSVKTWLGTQADLPLSGIPYPETRNFVKKVLLLRRLFNVAEKLKLIPSPQ